MHIMSKFMLTVLLERPRYSIKLFLAEEQAGFRRDRRIQQILMLQLIPEKATWKGQCICNWLVDFTKAFDVVKPDLMWAVLHSYGVDELVEMLKQAYLQARSSIRVGKDVGTWFATLIGTNREVVWLTIILMAVHTNGPVDYQVSQAYSAVCRSSTFCHFALPI